MNDVEQLPVCPDRRTVTDTTTLKPTVARLIRYAIDAFPWLSVLPVRCVFVVL